MLHPLKTPSAMKRLLLALCMASIAGLGMASTTGTVGIERLSRAELQKRATGTFDGATPTNATALPKHLILEPHPVFQGVLISAPIAPNTTTNGTTAVAVHEKRYLWFFLAALKLVDTGYAMYGLINNCKSWYGNGSETPDSKKFGCVYGAVSTLVTVAGGVYSGYKYGAQIGGLLQMYTSPWAKRDETLPHLNQTAILYQAHIVNTTALTLSMMFDMDGKPLMHNKTQMPLMYGQNHLGDGMVISFSTTNDTSNKIKAVYGFVPPPSLRKRQDYFNEEDFTSGGLEAAYNYNQGSDGGYLSTSNDYGQVDHEVSCLFGDLSGNAYDFQIYDNNHRGTIAGGIIRAYQDGPFDTAGLEGQTRGGIPANPACEVSR